MKKNNKQCIVSIAMPKEMVEDLDKIVEVLNKDGGIPFTRSSLIKVTMLQFIAGVANNTKTNNKENNKEVM